MTTLTNKVILITGATQGIGLATSKLLASKGARIVLVARSDYDLKKVSEQIPNAFAVRADIRESRDITDMVHKVVEHFGRIDVVINNAGQGLNASIETINLADFKKVLDLNVIGALDVMQQVIPIMRSQGGGQIVNISSVVSKKIIPYLSAYASTKYALNCLSLTAREELKKDNIIVSLVYPDLTGTNFGANLIASDETKTAMKAFFKNLPPADSPEYVAEKILEAIVTGEAEVYVR